MSALNAIRKSFGAESSGQLTLDEYQSYARRTYKGDLRDENLYRFLLLGLHGEIGSLLSELKKKQRDRSAYVAYARSAIEETGDVLWYLALTADAAGVRLSELAVLAEPELAGRGPAIRFADLEPQAALLEEPASNNAVQSALLELAARAGTVIANFREPTDRNGLMEALARVLGAVVIAAEQAHVGLEVAAIGNLSKLLGRWPVEKDYGALYDEDFHPDEQLPRRLEMLFRERKVGKTTFAFQSVHGVNVGDRLTDNSAGGDDYRFHDVFHLAFAAILGWSPVLRSLLKVKRKSDSKTDEIEDGARAQIAEEGISNWVFAHGLRHGAFKDVDSLDFALLKAVHAMVEDYEVRDRPLWMWEEAILRGFAVFRELKRHRGGIVIADLEARKLEYLRVEADPKDGGHAKDATTDSD